MTFVQGIDYFIMYKYMPEITLAQRKPLYPYKAFPSNPQIVNSRLSESMHNNCTVHAVQWVICTDEADKKQRVRNYPVNLLVRKPPLSMAGL